VPIILMDLPGQAYWTAWERFLREAVLSRHYISGQEFSFFKIIDNVDDAVGEIKTFYRNFHSYRFVRHDLVIRLNHPPAPVLIDALNQGFANVLKAGKITRAEPLAEEADDPSTLHLHRLRVPFNREDFARLRQMIDVINRED
jgi:hypothetical protein